MRISQVLITGLPLLAVSATDFDCPLVDWVATDDAGVGLENPRDALMTSAKSYSSHFDETDTLGSAKSLQAAAPSVAKSAYNDLDWKLFSLTVSLSVFDETRPPDGTGMPRVITMEHIGFQDELVTDVASPDWIKNVKDALAKSQRDLFLFYHKEDAEGTFRKKWGDIFEQLDIDPETAIFQLPGDTVEQAKNGPKLPFLQERYCKPVTTTTTTTDTTTALTTTTSSTPSDTYDCCKLCSQV